MRGDERSGGVASSAAWVVRPVHARGGERTVHHQQQLVGKLVGSAGARSVGEASEPGTDSVLVGEGDDVARVGPVGKLRCAHLERAAQTRRTRRQCADGVEEPGECVGGRGRGVDCAVEPLPEPGVGVIEVRGDQIVLGREVPVQGGLGDTGTLDDQVDSDRVEAVFVEQPAGRAQHPVPSGLGLDDDHGQAR